MRTRIITAIVALLIAVPVLIFSDTWAFPIAIAIFTFVGVLEMNNCIGNKNIFMKLSASILMVVLPLCARLLTDKCLFFMISFGILFVYFLVLMVQAVFSHGKVDVTDNATAFAMTFYVAVAFTSVILLRDSTYGTELYLLTFLGPWVSDSAAYFCGRALGKHKLIPDVSPKKTVEGAIGGIIFTGIAFVIYGFFVIDGANSLLTYIILALVGFVVSVISQVGDLMASLVKRKYNIKDYGKIFPGHGGVLDRFDSVLVCAPILYAVSVIAAYFALFQ